MRIGDLFDTPVADKIEPVIKVGERGDAHKLALEISSYVVTPMIEKYIDDILEHYTDTFLAATTEIGVWLSGYFGSGKSHLAKIIALIVENSMLEGVSACKRFEARLPPDAPHRDSIKRSLGRMDQCGTQILAFNLNTLTDSRKRPLATLLLSQYYLACGYCGNVIYARVFEAELDKQGKLSALHAAVERHANKRWVDIQNNPSYYRKALYAAACEITPERFSTPKDIEDALKEAERGELYNVAFLVDTILADLTKREEQLKKPQRLMLVLDESGQWIEGDQERLSQLQALVEEAAIRGQGKLWLTVTTHGDMGSIYKEARALEGDMKKIEGRFRFKPALTTENIELVLEDRLFRKNLAGKQAIEAEYAKQPGVLRGLGELANTSRTLTACSEEKFPVYYPFFPYQVGLIPEIVKSLRSKGGHGEQMSGSTRTLLAITQDILRAGRRNYLDEPLGTLVSFDEVYANLSGEGEVTPDVRTELSHIKDMVPGATALTSRVAEVLFLIREVPFIPRTRDNIARLLVENMDEDLPAVLARVQPELDRLIAAKLVALIGEEYEFLTGVRRTFEEEVTTVEQQHKFHDREHGMADNFVHESGKSHWRTWLGSNVVAYHDQEFTLKLWIDNTTVPGTQGAVELKFYTPLSSGRVTLDDLEGQSLHPDGQYTIFFLCGRVPGFDQDLTRYLATKEVIGNWAGDSHRSEEARELARSRETDDLPKLHRKVINGLKEGIRTGHIVFRGSSRQARKPEQNQTPGDALRLDMAAFWPTIYPKFDKVPVRIANDQKAICDVLSAADNPGKEVQSLRLYDKAGKIDPHCPLLDSVRIYLATEQNKGHHVLGKKFLEDFAGPPTGWDPNAVRVGVAALIRSGSLKLVVGKKPYSNPADPDLVDAIRVSRNFDKAELVLEETVVEPDVLTETRKFIMKLAKKRGIDETPAALCEAAGDLATAILGKAEAVHLWTGGSGMPLPAEFTEGEEAWRKVIALTNPSHRVKEVHTEQETLSKGHQAIESHADFQKHSGTLFTELASLVGQLQAIGHRLDPASCIPPLLNEYRTVERSAAFTDKAIWKQLRSLKARASLELTPLLDGWRNQARQQLQDALDRLPADLAAQGLDAGLQIGMADPLVSLQGGLDAVTLPAQVAALTDRAAQAVRQLGQRIAAEVRKKAEAEAEAKAKEEGKKVETKPVRQTRPIRVGDVATVTRVSTEADWDVLRDKLDKRVRQLLKDFDVELE